MLNLRTPGVYLREIEVTQEPLVRMSVAGFVGQAERGPLNRPQAVNSWGQFRDIFGDFTGYSYLAYSVFGFFLNGGERCYVVRVAHETAKAASSLAIGTGRSFVSDTTDRAAILITAINEGKWGNSVEVTVERESTRDLILTELDGDIAQGATTARFKSVAGLSGPSLASPPVTQDVADTITLVHKRDPIREKVTIKSIDYATGEVSFSPPVASQYGFPSGSAVIGRGFKLTFRYQPAGRLVREEVFDNLSLNPSHPNYFAAVINGDPEEHDYVTRIKNGNSILVRVENLCQKETLPGSSKGSAPARPRSIEGAALVQGADDPSLLDARYHTGYESGQYFRPVPPGADPATLAQTKEKLFGLAGFESVNEVGLIVMPDLVVSDFYALLKENQIPAEGIIFARISGPSLDEGKLKNFKAGQQEMLAHCERMGDRFAVLDSPRGAETNKGLNHIEDWSSNFSVASYSKFGALYYPWLRGKRADFGGRDLFIPPSGHVAGVYARVERQKGVGQAPANEVLQGVVEFEFCLSDAEQSILNPKGINCLRSFPGRGLMVWGARTLSSDPAWRYVNVRRLCLAIVKQIIINLQWTVFEPNDRGLWDRIVATLSLFLRDLYGRGALVGTKPEDAFFVKCDEETNPPEVVDAGQVVTLIGFAPARPAEFILLTVRRTAASVTVREQG